AQAAPAAIAPSDARQCRFLRRGQTRRSSAPVATDRLAPKRSARRSAARQRRLPDAKTCGAEVSRCPPGALMPPQVSIAPHAPREPGGIAAIVRRFGRLVRNNNPAAQRL